MPTHERGLTRPSPSASRLSTTCLRAEHPVRRRRAGFGDERAEEEAGCWRWRRRTWWWWAWWWLRSPLMIGGGGCLRAQAGWECRACWGRGPCDLQVEAVHGLAALQLRDKAGETLPPACCGFRHGKSERARGRGRGWTPRGTCCDPQRRGRGSIGSKSACRPNLWERLPPARRKMDHIAC